MPTIKLNNSDLAFDCAGDDTILRAALRHGHGFPYECNVGSCGNCRFELVEGEVVHERVDPPAFTERDKQKKRYLGCQARPTGDCKIKISFREHYKPHTRPHKSPATLTHVTDLTHDIREFRFKLERPNPFLPGQYALLFVPGVEGGRAYSMGNVTDSGAEWDFQIKKAPGGQCTTALFDKLKVGDTIVVDGPYGMAYLREDAPRDVLCLAGGSGLSPMVSIARGFARSEKLKGRHLHFVYGGRFKRDICGESMLQMLDGYGSRIHYVPVVSMAADDPDGGTWAGRTGFVHEAAKAIHGEKLADHEIYFAGPPAMADAVMKMLLEAKVPPAQIHFDQFY